MGPPLSVLAMVVLVAMGPLLSLVAMVALGPLLTLLMIQVVMKLKNTIDA